MSSVTVTVHCPVEDEDGIRTCEAEIEVECEVIPGEIYGADADGNRGMWVPEYLDPGITPDKCPECNTIFNQEQLKDLDEQIKAACRDYERPEPDYYLD